jgi:hypothetical protein
VSDVQHKGLGLFVMADWYDEKTLAKLRILDDNTHRYISPVTGGANVPALNDLLRPFGIGFGSGVLAGDWGWSRKTTRMSNGVAIIEFPAHGRVVTAKLKDETSRRSLSAPVFGIITGAGGNVAVYGDTNCADSAHRVSGCEWLFDEVLGLLTGSKGGDSGSKEQQTALSRIGVEWSSLTREQAQSSVAPSREPERVARFAMHSHYYAVSSAGKAAAAEAALAGSKGAGRRETAGTEVESDVAALPRILRTLTPLQ